MPSQMRLLALRLADGLAEAAQQRQILLPEAGMTGKTRNQTRNGLCCVIKIDRWLLVYINLCTFRYLECSFMVTFEFFRSDFAFWNMFDSIVEWWDSRMPLSLRVVEMVWKHSVSFTICLPWIGRVKSILSQDDLNKKQHFKTYQKHPKGCTVAVIMLRLTRSLCFELCSSCAPGVVVELHLLLSFCGVRIIRIGASWQRVEVKVELAFCSHPWASWALCCQDLPLLFLEFM